MKAMARYRSHSIEFKRQVAQEFIAGETLRGLAARHGVSRNLIRVWVMKFEAGAFDEDAEAADPSAADGTSSRPTAITRVRFFPILLATRRSMVPISSGSRT